MVTSPYVCLQAEREGAQELAAARHDRDSLHKEDAQELRVSCCLLAMCTRWCKSVLCIKSLIVHAETYASTLKCWGEDNAVRSLYHQRSLYAANVAGAMVCCLDFLGGHRSYNCLSTAYKSACPVERHCSTT